MLKIAFDPVYYHPLPAGHRFPMEKYDLIPRQLLREGTASEENFFSPGDIDEVWVERTHDPLYWSRLKSLSLTDKEIRRIGFPLSAPLIQREQLIASGTIACTHYARQYGVSLNIAGGTHHAFAERGEGYCLLNDQAIAANYLLANRSASKILIVDLDVHQGNGTACLFGGNANVFTFSMHGAANFPYHKERSDLDIPLKDKTSDAEYLDLLSSTLPGLVETEKPDFIFYLAGVDVLATDKLGRLALTREGCRQRDFKVLELCQRKQIPVVVCMGGGYSERLADIVEAHSNTFRTARELYF